MEARVKVWSGTRLALALPASGRRNPARTSAISPIGPHLADGGKVRTTKRRLLLQPIESRKMQELRSFPITDVQFDDLDSRLRSGMYRQMQAFLGERPKAIVFQSSAEHVRAVRADFLTLIGGAR